MYFTIKIVNCQSIGRNILGGVYEIKRAPIVKIDALGVRIISYIHYNRIIMVSQYIKSIYGGKNIY